MSDDRCVGSHDRAIGGACVDWAGVRHRAAAGEPRIASLVPSLTELLFALDLDAAVVARTGFCVHPRERVKRVPKVGGTKDVDLGKLESLAPTHLVVNVDENRREIVDAARAFVPNVIVTHPCAPDDNLRLYALFGAIFGRGREAAALAGRYRAARDALAQSVHRLTRERVLYIVWKKPWMTVARDTYIATMLALAGWDTLPEQAAARYPEVDDESPLWRDADRILLSTEPFAFRARDVRDVAARRGRPVALIDAEMTSWYGSRAIEGMRYLEWLRCGIASPTAV